LTDIKKILSQINSLPPMEQVEKLLQLANTKIEDDYLQAQELSNEALKIAQNIFYTKGIADSYKQLASCYLSVSNYGEVMQYALQAKELYESLDDNIGQANCLNTLGFVYNFTGDYKKRLACNIECLELREQANDLNGKISTLSNIGDTYTVLKKYNKALKYFEECLTYDLDDHMKAIVNFNIGEVNFYKKNYKEATKYINLGLDYALKSGFWQITIAAYNMLSSIKLINGNTDVLSELDKSLVLATQKNAKEDIYEIYELYSTCYKQKGNWQEAFRYLELHNELKNEVLTQNNTQKLKRIEFDFQFKSIQSEANEIKEKNKLLTKTFAQIELQRNEIESKNIAITDSIHYAKRIQNSILPEDEKIKKILPNSFVLYEPKDIVSGDFYWVEKVDDIILFSAIDCTGHGVPGAFVSLIAFNMLNKVVLERRVKQPSVILNELDKLMRNLFTKSTEKVRDGVDMGICAYNTLTKELSFAGAYHSLFVFDGSNFKEIKGNRESIGFSIFNEKKDFINHTVDIKSGDTVYLSTDGFPDQFGGEKGKKLKWKNFKQLLSDIQITKIQDQKEELKQFFYEWKNDLEQLDDVCVMGVKL
jgi:serine phosphatase RsbU (regulator of sigma subunit)